jgi:hypothetical protein
MKTNDKVIAINPTEIEFFKKLKKLSDSKVVALYDNHERVVTMYENADDFRQWAYDRHKIETAEKHMRMIYDYVCKFRKHLKELL